MTRKIFDEAATIALLGHTSWSSRTYWAEFGWVMGVLWVRLARVEHYLFFENIDQQSSVNFSTANA